MSDKFCEQGKEDYKKQARQIRNRRSAQESRDRKRKYLELLEETNEQLRLENENLRKHLKRIEENHAFLMQQVLNPGAMNSQIIPGMYSNSDQPSVSLFTNVVNISGELVSHHSSVPSMLSQDTVKYIHASGSSFHPQSSSSTLSLSNEEVEEMDISDESAELVISERSSSHFVGHPSGSHFDDPVSATICTSRPKGTFIPITNPQQSDASTMMLMGKVNTTACIHNHHARARAWRTNIKSLPQAQRLLVSFNLTRSLAIPIAVTIKNPGMCASQLSLLLRTMQINLIIYSRVITCLHILNCLYHLWKRHQEL